MAESPANVAFIQAAIFLGKNSESILHFCLDPGVWDYFYYVWVWGLRFWGGGLVVLEFILMTKQKWVEN